MKVPSIWSDGTTEFIRSGRRGGSPVLKLAFEALASFEILGACVRAAPEGEAERHPCRKTLRGALQRWEAIVPRTTPIQGHRFEILTHRGLLHLNARGLHRVEPFDDEDFVALEESLPVSWLPGRTFYQIFPDRFARGGSEEAWARHAARSFRGGHRPHRLPWGADPMPYEQSQSLDYFGGDLEGIGQRIDHLLRLGVGAVYLNPVFRASSNHRYDVEDYRDVDPLLGTREDLRRLVAALHDAGLRVIFDGVFNHCASTHPWFDREGDRTGQGAFGNPRSPHRGFFFFSDEGDDESYHRWNGVESLVKLDFRSEALRKEVFEGDESICLEWLRPPVAADGWRFDVANMMGRKGSVQLHEELWRDLRRAIKSRRPDAYLLGEHFFDGSALLDGSRLDGVMNYRGFHFPLLRWLTKRESSTRSWRGREERIDFRAEELGEAWTSALARMPHGVALGQMNLLGSHDTPRIRSLLKNDALLFLAFGLLMTWPGTPCVYYGDELGMEGGGDPDNRRCMNWDESSWNMELLEWCRRLVDLRRHEPFATGSVSLLHARGSRFAFLRRQGRHRALILANRGRRLRRLHLDLGVHHPEDGVFHCLAACGSMLPRERPISKGRIELELPPESLSIWTLQGVETKGRPPCPS